MALGERPPTRLEFARRAAELWFEIAGHERAEAYETRGGLQRSLESLGLFLQAIRHFDRSAELWELVVEMLLDSGVDEDDELSVVADEALQDCRKGRAGCIYDFEEIVWDRKENLDASPAWQRLGAYDLERRAVDEDILTLTAAFETDEVLCRAEAWGRRFPWTTGDPEG
jgi:hypothetical protein